MSKAFEFRIARGQGKRKGDDAPEYVVRREPRDHYTLYRISLDGVEIRKQISIPSLGDCEQGESEWRAGSTPIGFHA